MTVARWSDTALWHLTQPANYQFTIDLQGISQRIRAIEVPAPSPAGTPEELPLFPKADSNSPHKTVKAAGKSNKMHCPERACIFIFYFLTTLFSQSFMKMTWQWKEGDCCSHHDPSWVGTIPLRLHTRAWKKPFYPHKALLLPHSRTLILAFVLAVSRRPQLISFCSHWVRAQASQEHNCLETSMFLQLDVQEGFSHTLWFGTWDRGGGYAASLPTQLTQRARRKAHHLHSPWVTSGLRQFTVYISQQKQTTQIPRH